MRCLDIITNSDMNLSKLQEIVKDRGAWHAAVVGSQRVIHHLVSEQLTTTIHTLKGTKLSLHFLLVL